MNCWHMSGAGNDFMVIDARGLRCRDFSQMARDLCHKTGADGFMAVDLSEIADFKLHFYNSDGSRGEMCGNGSRCVCRFAYDHGIARETMVVETDAGLVPGWRLDEGRYRVKLNNPGVMALSRLPGTAYVELGCPGVPHAVTELPGLTWEMKDTLRDRAVALRHAPAFPKGANVNFYTWLGPDSVRILTFERGVEDYTKACGTGSGSVACVLWAEGKLPGGELLIRNPGGDLRLTVEGAGTEITSLLLEGPAELVKEYEV